MVMRYALNVCVCFSLCVSPYPKTIYWKVYLYSNQSFYMYVWFCFGDNLLHQYHTILIPIYSFLLLTDIWYKCLRLFVAQECLGYSCSFVYSYRFENHPFSPPSTPRTHMHVHTHIHRVGIFIGIILDL